MAHIDFKNHSITGKIVYYGPGLCGKTANLEYVNSHSKDTSELMAVSTEGDRTIFFDFLPMNLGKIRGIETQFKLYAVPGQVRYNMTRKLVLKDVDGVVFVVDSQRSMLQANLDSWQNLLDNLAEQGVAADSIPIMLQYNKRDLPNVMEIPELDRKFNKKGLEAIPSSALTGEGVFETLDRICRLVFDALYRSMVAPDEAPQPPAVDGTPAAARPADEPAREVAPPPASTIHAEQQPKESLAPSTVDDGSATAAPSGVALDSRPAAAEPDAAVAAPPLTFPPEMLAATARLGELVEQLGGYVDRVMEGCGSDRPADKGSAADGGSAGLAILRDSLERKSAALVEAQQQSRELERELTAAREALAREQVAETRARVALERERQLKAEAREGGSVLEETVESRAALEAANTARAAAEEKAQELTGRLQAAEQGLELAKSEESRVREELQAATAQAATLRKELETKSAALNEAKLAAEQTQRRVAELEQQLATATSASAPAPEKAPPEASASPAVPPPPAPAADAEAPPSPEQSASPPTQQTAAAAPEPQPEPEPERGAPVLPPETSQAEANEKDPFADNKEHQNASRIARVMVADLFLYNRDLVLDGIRKGNVRELLQEQLTEARKTYESRVAERIWKERDYLSIEFDRLVRERVKRMSGA